MDARICTGTTLFAISLLAGCAVQSGEVSPDNGFDAKSSEYGLNLEPVAWYPMTLQESSVLTDQSGNTLHAELFGDAPETIDGALGSAVWLDGESNYATPAHEGVHFMGEGGFTVTAFIRPAETGTDLTIASKPRGAHDFAWWFGIEEGLDQIGFYYRRGGLSASLDLSGSAWVHVAAVYDGATAQIYVDGVRIHGQDASILPDAWDEGAVVFGAWRISSGHEDLFRGGLDELRYYDHALTSDAISELAEHNN